MHRLAVFLVALTAVTRAQEQLISLDQDVQGALTGTNTQCYKLTLNEDTVRQVVWWEQGKMMIRLEPCHGQPHLKISVYGCPSQGFQTVYEYMSLKMKTDAVTEGRPYPADWEWPGDVETLTIDITHKTYFVQVENKPRNGTLAEQTDSSFTLRASIFDKNATGTEPKSIADLYPLKYMEGWDKKVGRENSSDADGAFAFGSGSSSSVVTIQWWPPGMPRASSTGSNVYQYAVFLKEITDEIGESDGIFQQHVSAACPDPGTACSPDNCRSCPNDYASCPKEFLTDCTETKLNIETLKLALQNETNPFESYVKNGEKWTAWTVCGAKRTMDRVDATKKLVTTTQAELDQEPHWFSADTLKTSVQGQLQLELTGLKDDDNNVYLVNVVVRNEATPSQTAIYEFMTLQLKTPRYKTPTLTPTDRAVIIGVSSGIAGCIIIFVIIAIIVRHKRKKRLAARIRMKQ